MVTIVERNGTHAGKPVAHGCPVGLDRDDPEYIRERQARFRYCCGVLDGIEHIEGLLANAVGGNARSLRALRKLKHRAEVLADDCLPKDVFLDRVFGGDW